MVPACLTKDEVQEEKEDEDERGIYASGLESSRDHAEISPGGLDYLGKGQEGPKRGKVGCDRWGI